MSRARITIDRSFTTADVPALPWAVVELEVGKN